MTGAGQAATAASQALALKQALELAQARDRARSDAFIVTSRSTLRYGLMPLESHMVILAMAEVSKLQSPWARDAGYVKFRKRRSVPTSRADARAPFECKFL